MFLKIVPGAIAEIEFWVSEEPILGRSRLIWGRLSELLRAVGSGQAAACICICNTNTTGNTNTNVIGSTNTITNTNMTFLGTLSCAAEGGKWYSRSM